MAKVTPTTAAPATAAAPATPAKPANSAAPGTPDAAAGAKKEKKKKVKRELHPALWDEKNETRLKLTAVPADYDPKKHKPLGRKDFEKESLWFEQRALKCEAQAAKFREMGKEADAIGGSTEKGKLKRLANIKKRTDDLIAQLKEAGVTDEEIKAALGTGA